MPGASMFEFQPGQAEAMVRGIASAVGGDEGLTPTQASVLGAICTTSSTSTPRSTSSHR